MKHRVGGDAGLEASLRRLAERWDLDDGARLQLTRLLECLHEDPLAPTAIREPARVLDDHLADSLVAIELQEVREAGLIADLGAGAGFPGLPLAIALPRAGVSLVESNGRKCEFITRAIEACRLENATVVNARAEAWPDGLGRFDLVTARALGPLAVVAEYGAPLLRVGGALLAWRGRPNQADEGAARLAAAELGLQLREPRRVEPYRDATDRHLQVLVKIAETPPRFPRRPGMARKRPLGRATGRSSDR